MTIFSKIAVVERPASVTALVHVIAGHKVLRAKFRHFFAILKLESRLYHLSKRHSVTRATCPLVSDWTHKVVAVNILEVVRLRKLAVRYVSCSFIIFSPFLSLFQGILESARVFTKRLGLY